MVFNDPSQLTPDVVDAVLARYGLRAEVPPEPAGGTASPKVFFRMLGRRFLLRRRRAEFCPEPVVAFDHSVMRHLANAGLRVIVPFTQRDGTTWATMDGATYEVFPFIEGLELLHQGNTAEVADAGRQLGRLHRATEDFVPEGEKGWGREFDMAANRATLVDFLETPAAEGAARPAAEGMAAMAERVVESLPDDAVDALPHCIIHGDYTWANILFRNGRVAGIFDFDWCDRQPRIHDLARGLLFFATFRERPLDPNSIRHLVQAWRGDEDLGRTFLNAYAEEVQLTEDERRLLPAMIAETWLCCRIRAMRKVPDEEKLEILTDGIAPTLDFLKDAAWPWGLGSANSQ